MTLKTLHLLLTSIIVGLLLGFFGATAAHYFRAGIDFLDNTSKNYFQNTTGFFFYFCALSLSAFIITVIKNGFKITRWHGPADTIFAAHRIDNELDVKNRGLQVPWLHLYRPLEALQWVNMGH